MKKVLILTSVLVLILCAKLASAETIDKEKGYISVSLSTTKEISPNQAEITIGIETSDKSMQKASEENKTIANKINSVLKPLLGADDYIKTNNYTARPQYIYTRENKKVLDKYVVTNSVVVKTKKTDLVSKLIDMSINQGATNINNLQFSSTDYDSTCNDALAELTKKTYNQAGSVAKSINSQVLGIKSINATCNADNAPRAYFGMMAPKAEDMATSSTPIEVGKTKIYANIDASFYVK